MPCCPICHNYLLRLDFRCLCEINRLNFCSIHNIYVYIVLFSFFKEIFFFPLKCVQIPIQSLYTYLLILQNYDIYAWWNGLAICFNIWHIFGIWTKVHTTTYLLVCVFEKYRKYQIILLIARHKPLIFEEYTHKGGPATSAISPSLTVSYSY